MRLHHRWAQATTALQVAIAMAAIALMTRKKWLEVAMYGMGAVGVAVGALALLHVQQMKIATWNVNSLTVPSAGD